MGAGKVGNPGTVYVVLKRRSLARALGVDSATFRSKLNISQYCLVSFHRLNGDCHISRTVQTHINLFKILM